MACSGWTPCETRAAHQALYDWLGPDHGIDRGHWYDTDEPCPAPKGWTWIYGCEGEPIVMVPTEAVPLWLALLDADAFEAPTSQSPISTDSE